MTPDIGASLQMIRFSFGTENSMEEVETTVAAVQRAVDRRQAMKFELCKDVVLTRDLPEERLKRGGIVKLVHPGGEYEEGYSAEMFNELGDSIAVITLPESALGAASLRCDGGSNRCARMNSYACGP